MENNTLIITHNAGFFSCYTIRLLSIVSYFNKHKKCPEYIDSSEQFKGYKIHKDQDSTHEYIKPMDSLQIEYSNPIQLTDEVFESQFSNYKHINFKSIMPFIHKYFSPSHIIQKIVSELETKYALNYDNLAVFYYRGTDKSVETNRCEYSEYIAKAIEFKKQNPTVQFLITSDEYNMIQLFKSTFPDTIIVEELLTHMNRSFVHSQLFLATVLIMSKAKYITCTSGNVSLWIVLFRGHNNYITQYLSPKEHIYGIKNIQFDSVNTHVWI